MNPYDGHLINLSEEQDPPTGYVEVPEQLSRAAKRKLAGRNEAHVSLTSGGKLAKFASKKRKEAREARRNNR
jgi:hypothetical protein